MLMQTYNEKTDFRIVVEEFNYIKPDREYPNGRLEIWGTKPDDLWSREHFSLEITEQLDALLEFLNYIGKYEPSKMKVADYFTPGRYWSHAKLCRYISKWIEETYNQETSAFCNWGQGPQRITPQALLAEMDEEPLPPGVERGSYFHSLYNQWLGQQTEPAAWEINNEWP